MAKITFCRLTSTSELDTFLSMTEHHSGVRLPPSYAKQARVQGAFVDGHLAGGYMLVTRPEFRTLMFVPDSCKNAHDFFNNSPYEMMEVNALWVGPAIKTVPIQLRFWTQLVLDIFLCRKRYLLLMSNPKNKAIQSIHRMTSPTSLYQGAPQLAGGQESHQEIKVGYTTRWNLLLNYPLYLREAVARRRRVRETLNARRSQQKGRGLGSSTQPAALIKAS